MTTLLSVELAWALLRKAGQPSGGRFQVDEGGGHAVLGCDSAAGNSAGIRIHSSG